MLYGYEVCFHSAVTHTERICGLCSVNNLKMCGSNWFLKKGGYSFIWTCMDQPEYFKKLIHLPVSTCLLNIFKSLKQWFPPLDKIGDEQSFQLRKAISPPLFLSHRQVLSSEPHLNYLVKKIPAGHRGLVSLASSFAIGPCQRQTSKKPTRQVRTSLDQTRGLPSAASSS